ncbi:peroxidasin homolog [Octopus bimaculoides]|nr:peroxidasin homolog [Octopus bimaculoides]
MSNQVRLFCRSLLTFLTLASIWTGTLGRCPRQCQCNDNKVLCMYKGLTNVVRVPLETTLLDLRSNKIKNIAIGTFSNLKFLETLLLNHNEIDVLTRNAFVGLPSLRELYLYHNRITTIQPGAFNELRNLEQLYLQNNSIKTLLAGVFEGLPKLRKVNLQGNPLVCDCKLKWLSDKLRLLGDRSNVTCESPLSVSGQLVSELSPDQFLCRAPVFTVEPEDMQLEIGTSMVFTCAATGDPEPEISWLHNGEILTQSATIIFWGDTLKRLMIQNIKQSDSGTYTCVASNSVGQTFSRAARLQSDLPSTVRSRVTEAPVRNPAQPHSRRIFPPRQQRLPVRRFDSGSFQGELLDIMAKQGDNITLQCVENTDPSTRISWTKDNLPLSTPDHITLSTTGSLFIVNIQQNDQGLYRCTATSSSDTTTRELRITLQIPPAFFEPPRDQTVPEGSSATLRCRAQGNPVPIITWSKSGEALPNNGRFTITSNELRILQVNIDDRGLYICRAESTAGYREATAYLAVSPRTAPSLVHRQTDREVSLNSQVTLLCNAEGEPTPSYRWEKDSLPLQYDNRIRSEGNALTFQRVLFNDAGEYECIAENIEGIDRNSFRLSVVARRGVNIGHQLVASSTDEAINRINLAANVTYDHLFNRKKTYTINDLLSVVRYPSAEALELAKAEEIFEQTLDIIYEHVREGYKYNLEDHELSYRELLSPEHIQLIANLSGCFRRYPNIDCSDMCFHKKYRSFDGTCNNLLNPASGASNQAFRRLLPPRYENGFNTPVGWNPSKEYNGIPLPSPRLVSSVLIGSNHVTDDDLSTHMLMQWGQFVDHDMDLAPQSISNARFSDGRGCNETCTNDYPCFPIQVPLNDQRIRNRECLGFSRSSAICNSGGTSIFFNTLAPREQLNAITAFIDGSNVYGSTFEDASSLRDLTSSRGLLQVGASPDGKALLPFDNNGLLANVDCQLEATKRHLPCFLAGDHRANEQLALTAMHTLWLRQHNKIATELIQLNPHWDGTLLYHESRKIVGAMMQHITYEHWLPDILGPKGMKLLGKYKGYDPQIDPKISNEFSTAAFRVGHTLIQPIIYRLNEQFQPIRSGNLPLHKAFFSPYRVVEEGGIDPLLRGLFAVPAKKQMPEEMFNSELTEKLFVLANSLGQDLGSLNIQRGRDHGLPSYNEYRAFCGMNKATSFIDLRKEIPDANIRFHLENLYRHPDNIDLFVGGISETPKKNSKVGPTFMCIIVDQFRRLRDGDRFWYENPGVFTADQLTQLRQVSLARVICDNSDNINQVQKNVFQMVRNRTEYLPCEKIPKIDIKMWSDCCFDCQKSGEFQSITSFYSSRRSFHSYPEDRQLFTSSNLPRDSQFLSDQPVSPANTSYFYKSNQKSSHLDTRVEGMEKTIKNLDRMVRKLRKQVFGLQKQQSSLSTCVGSDGKRYSNSEEWKVNDCQVCKCKNGQVECEKEICPRATCSNPKTVPGICCPMC